MSILLIDLLDIIYLIVDYLHGERERERERERALTNKTGLGLVPLNEKNLAIQRKP